MTDLTASLTDIWGQRKRIDWAWALIPIILAAWGPPVAALLLPLGLLLHLEDG